MTSVSWTSHAGECCVKPSPRDEYACAQCASVPERALYVGSTTYAVCVSNRLGKLNLILYTPFFLRDRPPAACHAIEPLPTPRRACQREPAPRPSPPRATDTETHTSFRAA